MIFSMIYYLLVILYLYFFPRIIKNYSWITLPYFIVPVVVFATFRGTSGKDTPTYIQRFFSSEFSFGSLDSEPLLTFLISLGRILDDTEPSYFFLLHSILVASLYFMFCKKYEISRYFAYILGPVFIVDGLTNGMRVILMYLFLLLSVVYGKRILLYFFALSSHVTGVIGIAVISTFNNIRKSSVGRLVIIIASFILIAISFVFFESTLINFFPRIFSKLDKYSDATVQSSLSGISDFYLIISITVLASFYNRLDHKMVAFDFIFSVLLCIVLYYLITLSSSFLRVNKFFILALTVSPFLIDSRRKIPSYMLIIVGLPYTINFLRQVIFGHGFLPYGNF